jgi:glycosyltransferase involved in cell wall biosynthesis
MQVVHVDSAFEWRGSENQVLLTALGSVARGHAVTLACRAGSRLEARARAAGLDVRSLAFGGDLFPGAILGVARLLREQRADVVHAHDPHATGAAVVAARLAGGVRVVASRRVALPLRGAPSRRKYEACDRVLAVSRAVADMLRAGGVGEDRLELVYEGVPDRPATHGARDVLREIGVPAGCPVIGNVAALTPHKDHATLLAAMPSVLDALPGARLVIVGDGELGASLKARVRALGLAERVFFTGFRRDLDRMFPAFSLLCLTSRTEGLGTSLLDAMCFGRPIVATATGGIPEVVEDRVSGRLVPVGDPAALAGTLVELLRDPAACERMGRAGRARFEQRFSAERMVDETLRVYEELVGLRALPERLAAAVDAPLPALGHSGAEAVVSRALVEP